MLIRLTIMAVVFIAVIADKPVTVHNQPTDNDATSHREQKPHQDMVFNTVVNGPEHSDQDKGSEKKPGGWHKFVTWPEGITTWLVMLTLGAIAWQAYETRRSVNAAEESAEAAKDSIRLQEMAMQQSAYLTNWKVNKLKSDPRKLRITVDLVNQSKFPMTLREGNLLVEEVGGHTRHSLGEATFLPSDAPMQIEIIVAAVPDQITEFEQGSLHLGVTGGFSHIDRISGKKIDQPVNGWLECGYWGTIFHWLLHMNPVESEPPKDAKDGQQ